MPEKSYCDNNALEYVFVICYHTLFDPVLMVSTSDPQISSRILAFQALKIPLRISLEVGVTLRLGCFGTTFEANLLGLSLDRLD